MWCLDGEDSRPALGSEHMFMQGIPWYDFASGCPFSSSAVPQLQESALKKLAGNGMHVNVVGLLLCYVFCNIEVIEGSSKEKICACMCVCMFAIINTWLLMYSTRESP